MTGSLRHAPAGTLPDDPYRRAVVRLDDGSDVAYRDVRRFGTWLLLEPEEVAAYLDERVGQEPLAASFRSRDLAAKLANRRAPLKAALLDQRTVAGLGNIYVDEALWRARLHPLRPALDVTADEARALHRAIRRTLERGIARQGATLRDYALPDGGVGDDAGRVQGLRPRRRAVPAVRHADREDPGRRARDVVLPALSAGAGGPELGAASNSSSPPSRSSRRSSAYPPIGRPSMRICGTVQPPVSSSSLARNSRSSSSRTSSYWMPFASSSAFARTQ